MAKGSGRTVAGRDIRYEACLQVAIGDYNKFIKEGERAVDFLQSALKQNNNSDSASSDSHTSSNPRNNSTSGHHGFSNNSGDINTNESNFSSSGNNEQSTSHQQPVLQQSISNAPINNAEHFISGSSLGVQLSQPRNDQPDMPVNPSWASLNNQPSQAQEDPRRVVEMEADKLANQATELARKKDRELIPRAIELLTAAIGLNPRCGGYFGNRSLCFYTLEQYEESLNDASLALQFSPENLKFLNRKASALLGLNRYSEALEVAKRMMEIRPNFSRALEIEEEAREKSRPFSSSRDTVPNFTIPNDPVDVVVVSRLPKRITAQSIRDLVCGICHVSLVKPIHFLVDNLPYSSAVVFLSNPESAELVATKLQNYPYGVNRIRVELLKHSDVAGLTISPDPPENNNGYLSSSSESSDNEMLDSKRERVPRPQSSLQSIGSDSILAQLPAANTIKTSSFASVIPGGPVKTVQKQVEPVGATSLFIGNVPSDTEQQEIENFISDKIPSAAGRYVVVKRPQWDYCFVNFANVKDAENAHVVLHKARFGVVVLDVRLQCPSTTPPPTPGSVSSGFFPTSSSTAQVSSNCTSLYIGNLPPSFPVHELLNDIYLKLSPLIKCDFALYKQTQWRHCFLNFETAQGAADALNYLNGYQIGGCVLSAKLSESKLALQASGEHKGREFVFSLDCPSSILRIDNLDGAVNDSELTDYFNRLVTSLRRETDFSVAYLQFPDVRTAASMMHYYQGSSIRRSHIVIRYAIPAR